MIDSKKNVFVWRQQCRLRFVNLLAGELLIEHVAYWASSKFWIDFWHIYNKPSLTVRNRLFSNHSRVLLIAFLVKGHILQARCMCRKLLNGTGAEVVASCEHNFKVSLSLQVVGYFGKWGALTHPIHTNKGHRENFSLLFGSKCLFKYVDVLLGSEEALDCAHQGGADSGMHGGEGLGARIK